MAKVVNLVFTYLTRGIEVGGSGGAIYLPCLVLNHTAWSAQKEISNVLGTRSLVGTCALTPMLLVANLANANYAKKLKND